MKKGFKWNRRGVSPVIATIIIVAIAIVMSIAVAYWMLGLGSAFTKYEKLEFTGAYATLNSTASTYDVWLTVKNTGSATATVDIGSILYNGKPANAYTGNEPVPNFFGNQTLNPGQYTNAKITLPVSTDWVSGMTVELMIHTTAGKDYPKVVMLP